MAETDVPDAAAEAAARMWRNRPVWLCWREPRGVERKFSGMVVSCATTGTLVVSNGTASRTIMTWWIIEYQFLVTPRNATPLRSAS